MEHLEYKPIFISNICAKFRLNIKLNLDHLNKIHLENFDRKKYNKKKFSGLITKYIGKNVTFLIFKSGNVIVCGAKSFDDIYKISEKLLTSLQKNGYSKGKISDMIITNICATIHYGKKINLVKLCEERRDQCSYETEIFINLHYESQGKKWVITHNGKVFGTGFKLSDNISDLFKNVENEISPYFY